MTEINIITDRAELEERLRELAETEYTGILNPGAMCYVPVMPKPEEYTCPVCGNITTLSGYNIRNIRAIGEIVENIRDLGFDVQLDEREFCGFCAESVKDIEGVEVVGKRIEGRPELFFRIRFDEDSDYHIARSNFPDHYKCVLAFLTGDETYTNDFDDTRTLHDNIEILQKMLGIGPDIPVPPKPEGPPKGPPPAGRLSNKDILGVLRKKPDSDD